MHCAISGEVPQIPVASRKNGKYSPPASRLPDTILKPPDAGTIYEKRLIESYIAENGTDPLTNETLTPEDLIELKSTTPVQPRPPAFSSLPSLLSAFQKEWDDLAIKTFKLQQALRETQQELSTALYQHDAAIRVIVRLTRERDQAREALSNVQISKGAPTGTSNGDAVMIDGGTLPDAIIAKVDSTQAGLGKSRRKRPVPDDWASADEISAYKPVTSSEPLYPGGSTLAIHSDGDLILVGGSDGVAGVYSLSQEKSVQALKGGSGTITSGLWAGSKAIVSTSSGRVKVFEGAETLGNFHVHAGEATAVALHPSGDILASVGVDKSYVLYDLETNQVLTQVYCDSVLNCGQFHPDGHLFATGGTDGDIKIFDVKSGSQAATFSLGQPLQSLYFSENGTWLAACVRDSTTVSIWDLRKAVEVKSLETGSRVDSICWDYTGQFLVAGGPGGVTVEQYSKKEKEWSEVMKSAVPARNIVWGKAARSIVVLTKDGVVTQLATKEE